MALWKPFRGNRARLDSVEKHEGYVYFCTDDGSLFFDYTDADGVLQRKQINAKDAETLMGVSLDELKADLATQDAVVLAEAQAYTDVAIEELNEKIGEGIDTSNLFTVDKITSIDTCFDNTKNIVADEYGVHWNDETYIDGQNYGVEANTSFKVPITAGNGIEFETDEENQVVRINSTGGGDGATVDKIVVLDTWAGDIEDLVADDVDGVAWSDSFSMQTEDYSELGRGYIAHRVPIVAGNGIEFDADNVNGVVRINSTVSSSATQIPITCSELKSLRDNSELIPGAFYRITDYICTTVQENTRAVKNKFDIIVQALSNNALSENASADYHWEEVSSGVVEGVVFKPSVIENDAMLVEGAVTPYYYEFIDFEGGGGEGLNEYKQTDIFIAYDYLENNDGIMVPVIYKTDECGLGEDADPDFSDPDYADIFYYVGAAEVDGVAYDKWRKINVDNVPWDSDGKIYLYTNIITDVPEGAVVTPTKQIVGIRPKQANLPAWELKYCLDNDMTRFAWADNSQSIINLESHFSNGEPLVRQPIFDGSLDGTDLEEYYYAWGTQADVDDDDGANFIYSKNEVVVDGEQVYSNFNNQYYNAQISSGKGVIYWMKDEHNNECPYDFKNIQFKRYMIIETDVEQLSDLVGHYFGITDGQGYTVDESDYIWCYTFSWLNGNNKVEDLSIVGPYLPDDEGQYTGMYDNVINITSAYNVFYVENPESYSIALNNNVFLSEWSLDNGFFFGCYSNTFGNDCSSNTFGNYCKCNTFGNDCHYNTFGNYCEYNTFGNGCCFNAFGDECSSNTFGNYCSSNTFGNYCDSNTFGNNCDNNIFDIYCYNNTFGNVCDSNTFDEECSSNTFGDHCSSNTFGNECRGNTFGNNCVSNTFDSTCMDNIFGSACCNNTFEYDCHCNNFGFECTYINFYSSFIAAYIESQCGYINFDLDEGDFGRNIRVCQGVSGKQGTPLTINCPPDLDTQTIYRASGSQEIILDI